MIDPIPQAVEKALKVILGHAPSVAAVFVFGSFATGRVRKDSDLDIAILPKSTLDVRSVWELASQISSKAGREVDLIDLSNPQVSSILKFEVVKTGRLIHGSDMKSIIDMKVQVMEQYHDLYLARIEIDATLRKRLKINAAA